MIDERKLIDDIKHVYKFDKNKAYGGVPIEIIGVLAIIDDQPKIKEGNDNE